MEGRRSSILILFVVVVVVVMYVCVLLWCVYVLMCVSLSVKRGRTYQIDWHVVCVWSDEGGRSL